MKQALTIILFVVFYAFSLNVHSQVKCTNKLLADIVEQLPDIDLDKGFSGEVVVPIVSNDKPVIVQRDSEGRISHIGIKFFDRMIIEKHPTPVYHFIERYFLELLLLNNQEEISTKLRMERVHITSEIYSMIALKEGLQNIVSGVSPDVSVYITCNNNRYVASCMSENKMIAKISFPVRNELITGFTKLESENSFYPELLMHTMQDYQPLTSVYMSAYKDDMYSANDDYYVTEDIVSSSYYEKKGEDYVPVFSSTHLEESVYNLFNSGYDWNIEAEVEQNLYGGKKVTFNISLAKLVRFMMHKQCSLYTGIRNYDKKKIEGVLMCVNMELGYQHILMFSFNKEVLNNPSENKVSIKMYNYVPIHNISSLF